MSNLARVLGGLATAAGQGLQGYGMDRQIKVRDALAQSKQRGDEERDRVLNALTAAQTKKLGVPATQTVFTDKGLVRVAEEGPVGPVTVPGVEGTLAKPQTEPTARFSFPTALGSDGKPVVYKGNNLTGELTETPVHDTPPAAGGVEKEKRVRALTDLQSALDSFEKTLTATGSAILPGTDKSILETSYNDALLKAKEAYNLGVLNGPDYMLMQKVLGDPTSLKNRVMAFGSDDEQTKRTLAQIGEMRAKFREQQANLGGGSPSSGTEEQQLWDAAVQKHGRDKVIQMYGPRP